MWTSILLRKRFGLLAWSLSAAAYSAMVAALQPSVMKSWSVFEAYAEFGGGRTGIAPEARIHVVGRRAVIMPTVAAYVVTQAAGWVADRDDRRTELILANPSPRRDSCGSRRSLRPSGLRSSRWRHWAAYAAAAGVVEPGTTRRGVSTARAGCVVLAPAIAGVRRSSPGCGEPDAITVLAVVVGMSYMLGLLVAMLEWPEWIDRLSVFWAFGHPYLDWPPPVGVLVLVTFAVAGVA